MSQNEQSIRDLINGNHDGLEEFYNENFSGQDVREPVRTLPTIVRYVAGGLVLAGFVYGALRRNQASDKSYQIEL